MKYIQLTKGYKAIVDDEDFIILSKYSWHINFFGYAERNDDSGEKRAKFKMHIQIMNSKGKIVDHINGDKLDNRKENLRICKQSENARNCNKSYKSTSGFKGVTWDKERNKWVAQIMLNRKNNYLGRFEDKINAAIAYNKAALKMHGEFAKLNTV